MDNGQNNEIIAAFNKRARGRPRQSTMSPEEIFKKEVFKFIIDISMNSITERFEAFKTHSDSYSFFYDLEHFEERFACGSLLLSCKNLEKALTRGEVSDIDGDELCNELRIIEKFLENRKIDQVIDILNLITKQSLESVNRI